jgi:hypothetical protein
VNLKKTSFLKAGSLILLKVSQKKKKNGTTERTQRGREQKIF